MSGKGSELSFAIRWTEPPAGGAVQRTGSRTWDAARTAAIVCDMWDDHWCRGAARRTAELAPRMNGTLAALRARGALIVHAPSDTMAFYADHPGRRLALAAPPFAAEPPLRPWVHLLPEREAPMPVDASDHGCFCEPRCPRGRPWSRQIESIVIADGDAIADGAEALYWMKARGIENVILLGVHTNMCVLGRPFGIRQLAIQGMNVVLMRDLTDSMYNPAMPPFVDHFAGTELVVRHIETYWCPSTTSSEFIGGAPFRFGEDRRPE